MWCMWVTVPTWGHDGGEFGFLHHLSSLVRPPQELSSTPKFSTSITHMCFNRNIPVSRHSAGFLEIGFRTWDLQRSLKDISSEQVLLLILFPLALSRRDGCTQEGQPAVASARIQSELYMTSPFSGLGWKHRLCYSTSLDSSSDTFVVVFFFFFFFLNYLVILRLVILTLQAWVSLSVKIPGWPKCLLQFFHNVLQKQDKERTNQLRIKWGNVYTKALKRIRSLKLEGNVYEFGLV